MCNAIHLLLVLTLLTLLGAKAADPRANRGAQAASESKLNIYIVMHSHLDVGWVWPIDEVYSNYIRYIYSTVTQELSKASYRTFTCEHAYFFKRWWEEDATVQERKNVTELITSGRFEFVLGAWVMSDEATTDYSALINQMTIGHTWLYDTFGVRPRYGWQIDPFGASPVQAMIEALMGFEGHVISRIDYRTKEAMLKNKTAQFVWRTSPSLGASGDIFTHVMDEYSYCTPGVVQEDPLIDGFYWNGYAEIPVPPEYNGKSTPVNETTLEPFADYIIRNAMERSEGYKTNHVLWPWGCDKTHFNATIQFEEMDKIMHYLWENDKYKEYNVKYATVGQFFDALHAENLVWPRLDFVDFFPYPNDNVSFWAGFYTSLPNLKSWIRRCEHILRVSEFLYTAVIVDDATVDNIITGHESNNTWREEYFLPLQTLREAVGMLQHHDGITGTMTNVVEQGYWDSLNEGAAGGYKIIIDSIEKLLQYESKKEDLHLTLDQNKIGDHDFKKDLGLPIVVYNPLGWDVSQYISVLVQHETLIVKDEKGHIVPSQINPCWRNCSQAPYELYFYAEKIPPIGMKTYVLEEDPENVVIGKPFVPQEPISLDNEHYAIFFTENGVVTSLFNLEKQVWVNLDFNFWEYNSTGPPDYEIYSDNYLFRPDGPAERVSLSKTVTVIDGDFVKELRIQETPNHQRLIRLFVQPLNTQGRATDVITIDTIIGPLGLNKECILRFETDLATNGEFYTDDNGAQTQKRRYNKDEPLPIAGNYYPLVYSGYIEDREKDVALSFIVDSPVGASSLQSGHFEMMLHRRLNNTIFFGMNLNDSTVARPSIRLVFEDGKKSLLQRQQFSYMLNFPPVALFGTKLVNTSHFIRDYTLRHEFMKQSMPQEAHLLSLEALNDRKDTPITLRVAHLFENNEAFGVPLEISLDTYFRDKFPYSSIEPRSLSMIWPSSELKRKEWRSVPIPDNATEYKEKLIQKTLKNDYSRSIFVLQPKHIATFYVSWGTPRRVLNLALILVLASAGALFLVVGAVGLCMRCGKKDNEGREPLL